MVETGETALQSEGGERRMVSKDYRELLRTLAIPTVSLGYSAVHIYEVDELQEAQTGYSVDPSGSSLVDDQNGSWRRKWVVIGHEDLCGDPIFIDTETEGFPVYTAVHGSGAWEPNLIATGLQNFAVALREIAKVAEGRENPVELEANPIDPHERANVLERIQRDNRGIDTTFWEDWLR
jgi:hypothetical protein